MAAPVSKCIVWTQISVSTCTANRIQCRNGVRSLRMEQCTGSLCVGSPSLLPQTQTKKIHPAPSSSTAPAKCGAWRPPPWNCWWIISSTPAARSRTTARSCSPPTGPSPAHRSSSSCSFRGASLYHCPLLSVVCRTGKVWQTHFLMRVRWEDWYHCLVTL